jgi:phage protein U
MIGSFGSIPFEVPLAPDSGATHSHSAEWAKHEVVGGAPVLEKTGRAADEYQMRVRLRRRWGDTVIEVGLALEGLRRKVDDGTPERLIIGEEYFGRFVLESVDTTYQRMTGVWVDAANVDLTFREYH